MNFFCSLMGVILAIGACSSTEDGKKEDGQSCNNNNDCPLPFVCDPALKRCVEDKCAGKGCGAGEFCDPSSGECKPESEDKCRGVTCGAGERCNQATGKCEPSGNGRCEGVECNPGERCEEASGACKYAGPAGECNVFTQDCDAGKKCGLTDSGAKCVADGETRTGGDCSGGDSCVKGNVCVTFETQVCAKICDPLYPECAEKEECGGVETDGGDAFGVCRKVETCDIFAQDCPEGKKCTLAGEGRYACATDGTKAEGENCAGQGDPCVKGCVCAGGSQEDMKCRKVCDPSQEDQCGESGVCNGVTGYEGIGVCIMFEQCDIFAQDCPQGEGCYLAGEQYMQACFQAGTVDAEQACGGDLGNCKPAMLCVRLQEGGDSTCAEVCSTDSDQKKCAEGYQCVGITGVEGVGICVRQS